MSVNASELWRALSRGDLRRERLRGLDALWHRGVGALRRSRPSANTFLMQAEVVLGMHGSVVSLGAAELKAELGRLREIFRRRREKPADVLLACALVREAARRELGLHAHREQVAGGLAMEAGCLAEMATGEGKTLAATFPAVMAGWRGRGCHIITVNEYLVQRDAAWMEPVYRACGVSVDRVVEASSRDERRAAYRADVTYVTNKEAAADFLRDRLVLGSTRSLGSALASSWRGTQRLESVVMRGLAAAIVDEADSVLIDEAVTPLILSGASTNEMQREAIIQAGAIADVMTIGLHFNVDAKHHEVKLTEAGRAMVASRSEGLGGVWSGKRRAEELVTQALSARHLFQRGMQYVVQDEAVVIVDDFTGRAMPDRTWKDGLHQAIEAKEGVAMRAVSETLARISFQRFFRLYEKLAGMSGTAAEEAAELWMMYRLPVVVIPPHAVCCREVWPDRVLTTAAEKWDAVVAEIERIHATGRPVLVGARTVEQSERISSRLTSLGLSHQVLNAVRHEAEAALIARAGERGVITIATNMAGRGTDIRLGEGVAALGGLHVIALEKHESERIDRQLFGRAGRQGDPGSAQAIVSLEDDLMKRYAGGRAADFGAAQRVAQRLARLRRAQVLRSDDWLEEALGFAGQGV